VSELSILDIAETDFGTVYLGSREVLGAEATVFEILIGDDVLMTSLSPVSERRLSTSALAQHAENGPLRVLVGGLGLGYTAHAALIDPRVGSVRVAEKMSFIIDWMNEGKLPLSEEFASDKRLSIEQSDVYKTLLGPASERFDLILIDVDHAPDDRLSEESAPFYTAEGQRRVLAHLRPGGILGVWSVVENDAFLSVLSEVYAESRCEEVAWQDLEFPEADYQNALFFAQTPR
jgi:spermidine synthase